MPMHPDEVWKSSFGPHGMMVVIVTFMHFFISASSGPFHNPSPTPVPLTTPAPYMAHVGSPGPLEGPYIWGWGHKLPPNKGPPWTIGGPLFWALGAGLLFGR